MSDKANRVMAVWVSLTPAEKAEAIKLINEYQKADGKNKIALDSLHESRSLVKSSTTMNFGPLGGGCPYCGK